MATGEQVSGSRRAPFLTSVFYEDQAAGRSLVRFAFCKKPEVLDEAVARLAKLGGA